MNHLNSLKWGLYLGIATSLATQILTWAGLGLTQWFVVATYLLVIASTVLFLRNHHNRFGSVPTIVQTLIGLVIMILVARLIFQWYMFVYTRHIEPGWVEKVAVIWTDMMNEQGLDQDVVDRQIGLFRNSYKTVPMFTSELLKYAVPQFVLSLVTAGIMWYRYRRRKPIEA